LVRQAQVRRFPFQIFSHFVLRSPGSVGVFFYLRGIVFLLKDIAPALVLRIFGAGWAPPVSLPPPFQRLFGLKEDVHRLSFYIEHPRLFCVNGECFFPPPHPSSNTCVAAATFFHRCHYPGRISLAGKVALASFRRPFF